MLKFGDLSLHEIDCQSFSVLINMKKRLGKSSYSFEVAAKETIFQPSLSLVIFFSWKGQSIYNHYFQLPAIGRGSSQNRPFLFFSSFCHLLLQAVQIYLYIECGQHIIVYTCKPCVHHFLCKCFACSQHIVNRFSAYLRIFIAYIQHVYSTCSV